MYAVIETGGKQYRVSPGQTIEVELLPAEPGSKVTLDRVLLVSDDDGKTLVGTPVVAGGAVTGTVVREGRGKKIVVFKYKAKKRYRRTRGHRQDYMYLLITDIQANGTSLVPSEERQRLEAQGERQAERYQQRLMGLLGEPLEDEEIEIVDEEEPEEEIEAEEAESDETE